LESEIRRLTRIINPPLQTLPEDFTTDNMREDHMLAILPVPSSPQKDNTREDEVSDIENIPKPLSPQRRIFLDSSTETISTDSSYQPKKSKSPKKKKKRSKTPEKPPRKTKSRKTSTKKRKITKKSTASVSKKSSKSKSSQKSPSKLKKKHKEYETVSEARRYLASHSVESFMVSSYNLRPRKYRFVDKSTRSPYKMIQPMSTTELSRTDPLYSRRQSNIPTTSLKRKRLEF